MTPVSRGRFVAWRWVFVAAMVVSFAIALAPTGSGADWFAHADKLRHLLAFAVLWVLGRRASIVPAWRLALLLLVFGAAIEVAQGWTGYRMASLADWLADGLGVALAWRLWPLPGPRSTVQP